MAKCSIGRVHLTIFAFWSSLYPPKKCTKIKVKNQFIYLVSEFLSVGRFTTRSKLKGSATACKYCSRKSTTRLKTTLKLARKWRKGKTYSKTRFRCAQGPQSSARSCREWRTCPWYGRRSPCGTRSRHRWPSSWRGRTRGACPQLFGLELCFQTQTFKTQNGRSKLRSSFLETHLRWPW